MSASQLLITRSNASASQGLVATPAFTTFTTKTLTSRKWTSVVTNNNGTWIFGADDGYIAVSTDDGSTFTEYQPTPAGYGINPLSLTFIDGKFWAQSTYGFATSTNGSSWTYHATNPGTPAPFVYLKTRYGIVGLGTGDYVNPAGSPYYGLCYYTSEDPLSSGLWSTHIGSSYLKYDTPYTVSVGDTSNGWFYKHLATDGNQIVHISPGTNQTQFRVHSVEDLFNNDLTNAYVPASWSGTHSIDSSALTENKAFCFSIIYTGSFWMAGGYYRSDPHYHPAWWYSADGVNWTGHVETSLGHYMLNEASFDGTYVYFAAIGTQDASSTVETQPRIFRYDPTPPSAGTWSTVDIPAASTNTFYSLDTSPDYIMQNVLQSKAITEDTEDESIITVGGSGTLTIAQYLISDSNPSLVTIGGSGTISGSSVILYLDDATTEITMGGTAEVSGTTPAYLPFEEPGEIEITGGDMELNTTSPQGTGGIELFGYGLASTPTRQRGGMRVQIFAGGHIPPRSIKRRLVVCEADGTPYDKGVLAHAVMGDVTWEANNPDDWSFTISGQDDACEAIFGSDPGVLDLGIADPYREVTLWRGDDCLSWGPMHSMELRDGVLNVTGSGLLEYYNRRFIGFPGPKPNYLEPNSDFELGDAAWGMITADVMAQTNIPATSEFYIEVALHPITGELALHIHDWTPGPEEPDPPDAWVPLWWQAFAMKIAKFDAQGYPWQITASADCYVERFLGPNMWSQGISLGEYPDNWTSIYTDFKQAASSNLDKDEAPDTATLINYDHGINRHEASMTIPPATGGIVQFKLFGCKGDTWWSNPRMYFDQGIDFKKQDIGQIAWQISDHVTGRQTTPLWPLLEVRNGFRTDTFDKSDLGINAVSLNTGETRTIRYLWSQRTNGLSALQDLTGSESGLQFWMDYHPGDPDETRHRRFMAARFKGETKHNLPLRYHEGLRGNLTDVAFTFEGQQASNAIVVASSGGGVSSPEAGKIRASSFAGGLTLEEVVSAPPEATYSSFDNRASFILNKKVRPVSIAAKLSASPYYEKGMRVGDRVPVSIHYGPLHLTEELMWITRMTLTADDYLEIVLQYWPNYQDAYGS